MVEPSYQMDQLSGVRSMAVLIEFVEYPADIVAAIKKYSAKGWRVHCGFWCDTNAWVPAQSA